MCCIKRLHSFHAETSTVRDHLIAYLNERLIANWSLQTKGPWELAPTALFCLMMQIKKTWDLEKEPTV
jgi:hypothetical protein